MADISAPYYPEDEGARLVTDVFQMERQLFDENDDPVDTSGWVIGIEITSEQNPTVNHIIENDSAYLTRPQNHIIRLKSPTPLNAGMTVLIQNATTEIKYQMRWYRLTDDGQVTFWYVDMGIYGRFPKDVNKYGPLLAEVFRHQLTAEGGVSITTEIAGALETRIFDLESLMSVAAIGKVTTKAAAQALATGTEPRQWVDTVLHRKYLFIPGKSELMEEITAEA